MIPHNLQFGFRSDYGALPACFVLKEAISFYVDTCKGSPVHCAFLDNEKLFDRIWQNDILYELYNLNVDTRLWQIIKKNFGNLHIPNILLADDTFLMSNSPKSLQCLLNHVEKYAFTWRLHNNPIKSVFIVFNRTKKFSVSHSIKLFRSDIPQSDSTIYLATFYNQT